VDANNCQATLPPIEIIEPETRLELEILKEDISCFEANDGAIQLNITGGVAPYQVNWNFGSTGTDFENVGPGTYVVTVSDQAGCILTESVTVTDAPVFKVNPVVKQISCFGEDDGSIQLNIEGNLEGVNILWDNGQELPGIFNLVAGTYGVTLTKFGICPIRREFTILQPDPLIVESIVTDALDCANPQSGNILVNVSGGSPPFTFRWTNGSTQQNLINVSSGPYGVEIQDANGCVVEREFVVRRPPPIEVITQRNTEFACEPREVNENFSITVSGGVPPYTINWSGGEVSENGLKMTANRPGLYILSVRDGSGCEFRESFEVENSDVLIDTDIVSASFDQYSAFLVGIPVRFENKSIGNIITYFWDFGDGNTSSEPSPTHTYQAAGSYEITLQAVDKFGCIVQIKKNIEIIDYFLVVPNVFSPNGDGINDYFFPKYVNIKNIEFWIINKWGETIYFSNDINGVGWDGKVAGEYAMPGNYVYKLKFETVDGRVQTQTEVFLLLK
jgi:large repetitive protein